MLYPPELVTGNGLDGCMGPVGHAGERALETEARLSREVAAHSLYQTLRKWPLRRDDVLCKISQSASAETPRTIEGICWSRIPAVNDSSLSLRRAARPVAVEQR